jgi:hypothetical protein
LATLRGQHHRLDLPEVVGHVLHVDEDPVVARMADQLHDLRTAQAAAERRDGHAAVGDDPLDTIL